MGRTRKLDGEAILRAAEEVARRDGAAGLTLGAVATHAGVGKATVLYDHKTMNGLVVALIRRLFAQEERRIGEMQAALGGRPDAAIRARIAAADRCFTENERSLVNLIVATVANNPELREAARDFFDRSLAEVTAGATAPRSAAVAFLALHGATNLRSLGLFDRDAPALRQMLDDIEAVARTPIPAIPGEDAPVLSKVAR